MNVEKISAITITIKVNDMARSVHFYNRLLGLKVLYGGENAYFSSLQTLGVKDTILNLGARLKIDVLRTDSSREAPIRGYPVQCASANVGTAPMVGILGSILFPLPTFF